MIKICPYCGKAFETDNERKKWCCNECKDAYHNREKTNGIHLWPENQSAMQAYAVAWDSTIENVVNIWLKKHANTDGAPVTQKDAFGL